MGADRGGGRGEKRPLPPGASTEPADAFAPAVLATVLRDAVAVVAGQLLQLLARQGGPRAVVLGGAELDALDRDQRPALADAQEPAPFHDGRADVPLPVHQQVVELGHLAFAARPVEV